MKNREIKFKGIKHPMSESVLKELKAQIKRSKEQTDRDSKVTDQVLKLKFNC